VASLALVGTGWHSRLFREEISALVGDIEILHPRIVSCENKRDTIHKLGRSSLLDEVLIMGGNSLLPSSSKSQVDLCEKIGEWALESMEEGDFAVRARKIGDLPDSISSRIFENAVGRVVSANGRKVDLEKPSNEIVIVIAGSNDRTSHPDPFNPGEVMITWGLKEGRWSKQDFSGRSPTERPYFKPISLEPRQARLLISLASIPGRDEPLVIDPFCGTGGIAIEAALQDFQVLASDLDSRMVDGTKQNLNWAGKECTVERWDASNLSELWGSREGCAFVFDPPYGRSSWKSDDSVEIFLSVLNEAMKIDPRGVVSTMLPAGPDILDSESPGDSFVMGRKWSELMKEINGIGWKVSLFCPIRVHRSLVRVIVVCHPSD